MCNTDDNHTRQAHRNLELELDRSRRGVQPISARNWTDLDAEYDRFRCGSGPISSRSTTDLGEEGEEGMGRQGTAGAEWT